MQEQLSAVLYLVNTSTDKAIIQEKKLKNNINDIMNGKVVNPVPKKDKNEELSEKHVEKEKIKSLA